MNESIIEGGIKIMGVEEVKIIELAKTIKSWSQVLRVSINHLDEDLSDDTVALHLEIDKGNFSRILKGQSNFPMDKLIKFCKIVGHDLPLHWLAYQAGYELRVIPKTLEEKLIEKDKIIEERDKKIAIFEEMFMKLGKGEK